MLLSLYLFGGEQWVMLCYVLAYHCLQTFFAVKVTALGVVAPYSLEKSYCAPETLAFTKLHNIPTQKTILFIVTTVKTSDPTFFPLCHSKITGSFHIVVTF
jgi:hypothetical protein